MDILTNAKEVGDYIVTFRHQIHHLPLKNATVIQLYIDRKKNASKTAEALQHCHCFTQEKSSLKVAVSVLYKTFVEKKKHLPNYGQCLFLFLNDNFKYQPSSSENLPPASPVPPSRPPSPPQSPPTSSHCQVLQAVTRNCCTKCTATKKDFVQKLTIVKNALNKSKKDYRILKSQFQVKRVNQNIKRLHNTIAKLRKTCADMKRDNRRLSGQLSKSHATKIDNKILKRKFHTSEKKLFVERQISKKLKAEICVLENEYEDLKDDLITNDSDSVLKIFVNSIRKAVYKALECNVAVSVTSSLLQYIVKCLCQTQLARLPHQSTVARCAYELGVVTDLQVADFMVRSADLTIAWDATTINGIHVNEIHVCSAEGMHSLTTGALAGGKTDDYVGHIVDSIRHAAHIYAAYYELQSTSIFKDLASKFQCTLSDRASVNHCVSQRLSMELEVELVELNCNLHPLECVATASREALLEHEKKLMGPDDKRSNTFGKMAGAVNLISAISKLREFDAGQVFREFDAGQVLEMENYTKGETRKVYDPPLLSVEGAVEMRVSNGSKLRNLLGFAFSSMEDENVRHVTWFGTANAVSKTISCAEILKRKIKGLHQITQIGVLRVEDYWEPIKEGLDTLKVNTNTPAISIVLSKDPLDTNHPSYQAPGSTNVKWAGSPCKGATPNRSQKNAAAIRDLKNSASRSKRPRSDKKPKSSKQQDNKKESVS